MSTSLQPQHSCHQLSLLLVASIAVLGDAAILLNAACIVLHRGGIHRGATYNEWFLPRTCHFKKQQFVRSPACEKFGRGKKKENGFQKGRYKTDTTKLTMRTSADPF